MKLLRDTIWTFAMLSGGLLFALFLTVLLSSCGPHQVNLVQDKPFVVQHEFSLDEIRQYFVRVCIRENPAASDAEIENCADQKISDFISAI
jgi:hypothetical protein